jgi:hypothetical protein
MTEESKPTEQPTEQPAERDTAQPAEQAAERTQAAARAARRARRIGGRSGPAEAGATDTGRADAGAAADIDSAPAGTATASPAGASEQPDVAVRLDKPSDGEPGPDSAAGPRPADAASARRAWLPAIVLAIVCLGFLGWGIYDSHGVWWAKSSSSVADERGPVLAAAKSCMAAMNTYDYRKLAQSEAKGVACTTGTFTGQYQQAFEKLIKPQAAKVKFTQTAQINNAGVESVSGDGQQWVVLVYGQLSTTNSQTGTKAPTLTPFSARVTMQHVGAKWLVANYQYAPTS